MKSKKLYTLCFIVDPTRILLAMKKRGFGVGKWNGYGGKVTDGETIEAAAEREIMEEGGIRVKDLSKIGVNTFEFTGNPVLLEVHVFKSTSFEGEPIETEEMKPQWFSLDAIPYKEMWKDDPFWLPIFLSGKIFEGKFLFDETGDKVLKHEVKDI